MTKRKRSNWKDPNSGLSEDIKRAIETRQEDAAFQAALRAAGCKYGVNTSYSGDGGILQRFKPPLSSPLKTNFE